MKKLAPTLLLALLTLTACTPSSVPDTDTSMNQPIPSIPTESLPTVGISPSMPTTTVLPPTSTTTPHCKPSAKRTCRVLYIMAPYYEETEFNVPRMQIERVGYTTIVAGPSLELMVGSNGTEVRPDVVSPTANVDEYDALIFVGGSIEFLDYYIGNPDTNRLIQTALEKGKIVAAICRAVDIFIEADILTGIQATIIEPEKECKKLEEVGAICTGAFTQRDGLIITSQGPHSALSFGRTIGEALLEP